MQPKSDAQLLRDYANHGVDAAFTELVHQHTNLVYSAALRQTGSPETAADISQKVFLGLAQSAQSLLPRLTNEASIAGWLCRCTRNLALNHRRDEFRRQSRQKTVMEQLVTNTSNDDPPDWEQLCLVLDDAMSELAESDYDLLVLRFYKSLDYRAVGAALNLSDDTAQKRVTRAIEKLRTLLSNRGVDASTAALCAVISANAIQAAPAGLATTIALAALATTATTSTSTFVATTKVLAMTTLQKSIITATVAVLAGAGFYQAHQVSRLRGQVQALEQRQAPVAQENQQLLLDRDDLKKRLAALASSGGPSSSNLSELLKLRSEVTRLRQTAQDFAQLKAAMAATGNDPAIEATLKSWATRATQLKARLEQMPDKKIPELQLLTEKDWFDAVKGAKQFESDTDYREALHNLRNSAKGLFGDTARAALKKFAAANNGALPSDLSQLKPYFEAPIDDAILSRYALIQTGNLADVPRGAYLLGEKAPPVDDQYDSRYQFNLNGTQSSSLNYPGDIVEEGLIQFAKAHNGNLTSDPSDLTPYLRRPLDPAKVREILSSLPPGITTLDQLKATGSK